MKILGVKVDNLEKKEILEKIENFLAEERFRQIATVNPEFILAAQKDEKYKNILNSCDFNIADGMGIRFAFWRYGEKLKARMAGADLFWEILKIADNREYSIFLVANKDGLSSWEETAGAIERIYPNLKINGSNLNKNNPNYELQITNYEIVFCNFGHPYQEIFLNNLKYAKIRLAMGVGGSFDFITGKLRRAPLWMRKIGLEWLFRLIQQPKRIKRIFNAVILFPITVLLKSK